MRKKKYKRISISQVAAVILLFSVTLGVTRIGGTVAYYNDTETSSGNSHIAGQLDFILDQSAWTPSGGELDLDAGESVSRDINVVDVYDKSIEFKYIVWPEKTSGDDAFCNALQLTALLEGGAPQYSGPLFDFLSATTTFATTTTNIWTFDVSLPSNAPDFDGQSCSFDFVYSGWQIRFPGEGEGYHDIERASSTIESGAPEDLSVCPFRTGEGRIVIEFNDRIRSNKSEDRATAGPVSGFVPAGTYDITLASYDAHSVHGGQGQINEQWHLILDDINGDLITTTSAISDLPEDDDQIIEKVETDFVLDEDVFFMSAFHEVYPNRRTNSIEPICAMFESQEAEYIVLNEFLPNPTGDDDALKPDGEWVELYNLSTVAIDVDGWYLYDSLDSHPIPISVANSDNDGVIGTGETIVPPGGYLVVYLDGAYSQGWLNNDIDTLRLYNGPIGTGVLVDSYSYDGRDNSALTPTSGEENVDDSSGGSGNSIPENKSYARIPDGIGAWVDPIPTPLAPNMADEIIVLPSSFASVSADTEEEIIEEIVLAEEVVIEEIIASSTLASSPSELTATSSLPQTGQATPEVTEDSDDAPLDDEPVLENVTVESKEEDVTPSEFTVLREEDEILDDEEEEEINEDEEPVDEIVIEPIEEEIQEVELAEDTEELPVIVMEAPEVVKIPVIEEEEIIIEPIVEIEPEIVPEPIEELIEEEVVEIIE